MKLWRVPTYKSFLTALTLCGWASFTFGWHVHEKAVLLVLVPLRFALTTSILEACPNETVRYLSCERINSLMAADSNHHLQTFIIASVAGIASLFPLIFTPIGTILAKSYSVTTTHNLVLLHVESIFKVGYSTLWCAAVFSLLSKRVYQ